MNSSSKDPHQKFSSLHGTSDFFLYSDETETKKNRMIWLRLFSTNRSRIVIILASNLLISVLQSNLASLFSFIGQDFGQGVAGLGLASSLMFLGICISEIPGGILEARIGARNAIAQLHPSWAR